MFHNDLDISLLSWIKQIETAEVGFANSIFASRLIEYQRTKRTARYEELFPRGIPAFSEKHNFILETATDWVITNLSRSRSPFFSYVHLYPPHSPCRTRWDFIDQFNNDVFTPIEKPLHPLQILGSKEDRYKFQTEERRWYDEFILYVDSEFNRLMQELEERKILDDTIIILTSDHGEMFERGIPKHLIPSFHRPLMHIPLLIFLPGQKERVDIHSLTTTVDILPTLLQLSGKNFPEWLAGEILPPFNSQVKPDRSVFSMDFRHNPKTGPIENGSLMLCKGPYKLTYLFGNANYFERLDGKPIVELYNVESDPEELNNLFDQSNSMKKDLTEEMFGKINQIGLDLVGIY